jgi:hypothetical protein
MLYAVFAILVALLVVAFLIASWWGAVVVLVLGGFGLVYMAAARRRDPSVGAIERGRRREPTGTVRSGSADVETANQRQGQE